MCKSAGPRANSPDCVPVGRASKVLGYGRSGTLLPIAGPANRSYLRLFTSRSSGSNQRSITGVRRGLPSLEAANVGVDDTNHRRRATPWRAVLALGSHGIHELLNGARSVEVVAPKLGWNLNHSAAAVGAGSYGVMWGTRLGRST